MQIQTLLFAIISLYTSILAHSVCAAESDAITPQIITASLISATNGLDKDSPTHIALRLQNPEGWHTYWRNSGDSGMPTNITLSLPEGYTHSAILWPTPDRFILDGITSFGYHGDTIIPITITPPSTPIESSSFGMATITAKAEWLACKDICVPESANLELLLPEENTPTAHLDHQQWIDHALARVPQTPPLPITIKAHKNSLEITVARGFLPQGTITTLDLFPITENTVANTKPIAWKQDNNGLHISLTRKEDAQSKSFSAVLTLEQADKTSYFTLDSNAGSALPTASTEKKNLKTEQPRTTSVKKPPESPTTQDTTLIGALALALLGGLILNAMPCVLPVLSLKLLSLAKKAHLSRKESLKHGIAYSTGVLTCFTILGITMIAIQHAGVLVGWGFQLQSPMVITLLAVLMFLVGLNLIGAFTLPDILGSTGDTLTRSNNASGSFFTGALAAIAATPCTAPFMAPAVGFALTQHPSTALLIFVMIGVGMASPYLLISLFPTCLRFLPRSGAWMETLRQFFAFPMFATAAWLLWVMTRQACTDALAPALSILVLVAFITWTHRSIHTRSLKIILLVSSISCVIYTLTLIERPSSFKSNEEATHIAYSTEKLSQLRKEGTPVLVNATADWCLTCKVNEITTLSSDAIALHFKTQGITYMIADWTKRDDAITKFLREHQRQGVPTYVFYPPHKEGIVLPQILSVETVKKITCVTGCEAH